MNHFKPTLRGYPSRTPALRSRGSCRGFAVCNDRVVVFESHLELMVLFMLWTMVRVKEIVDQPKQITFIDDDGIERGHTFDFLVVLDDGTRILIAVKPAAKLAHSGLRRKVRLIAEQLSPGVADRINIVTDADFSYADRFNATQAFECNRFPIPAHDDIIASITENTIGAVKISDLVEKAGVGGAGYRAVVRCITSGLLAPAATRQRITADSYVIRRHR
ncbi:MAG: TnsA endonuclease N-terminal domain-containing protein [Rhizobiales bacterium]|nr:TnsA endonuclease N-terminal domain-containing protein [Hyphomicrobiales bacterium]